MYEVSNNLAFIKNFGNIAVFKNDSTGLLIDTGMGVSSMQVIEKLKEWGISNIEYIIYTHGHVDHVTGAEYIVNAFEGTTKIIAHENVTKRFDTVSYTHLTLPTKRIV